MAETLRERVERKIKAKADDRGAWIPVHAAVEIALEYAEREAELWNSKFLTLDKMRERAEAAETIISQQNIERERIVVEAHRNVEAAEKERDDHLRAWKVKAELLDKRNRELAEYREKWGHAAGCLCHEPCASVGNATGVLPTICGLGLKDCRDPRCSGGDRG